MHDYQYDDDQPRDYHLSGSHRNGDQRRDYERIEALIHYIDNHSQTQPELEELAKRVELSPFHLQKLFKLWAGVSPKQFLKLATLKKAREYLRNNASILDASHDSGLSSSSRLYDHFVTIDAVTPGEFKSGGAGLVFFYGSGLSPYGSMFIAWTERGIHRLIFSIDIEPELENLKAEWPHATFTQKQKQAGELLGNLLTSTDRKEYVLRPRGTNFQIQVWRALLHIPPGLCVSYGELAQMLGKPEAARAVGSAVGANSLALLIPCHRVIQASGVIGDYRWGEMRKRIVLAREYCLQQGEKDV